MIKFLALKFINGLWIGITFIPSIILDLIYDPIARKSSRRQLPKTAEKLGLKFIKSAHLHGSGELTGIIRNYKIIVKPDEDGKVIVLFNTIKPMLLSTEKSIEKAAGNMKVFKTANNIFNRIFKTRRASKDFSDKITGAHETINNLIQFYIVHIWSIRSIYISDSGIYCSFKYGHPFFPYIPPSAAEQIITDMVNLAEQLDKLN